MSKQSTASRILNTARELFNEQGVESVSVAQIAGEIGISTGNFTYHYAKKKDVVDAHTEALERAMLDILENFAYSGTARDFIKSHLALFKVIWEYRFLFNGTSYLIQHDLLDPDHYQGLIDHVYSLVLAQCENLIASKAMKAIPEPHDVTTLVDCIWWQWLGWLDANQLVPEKDRMSQDEVLESGLKHMLFLIQPYMHKRFIKEVYTEFHDFDVASI